MCDYSFRCIIIQGELVPSPARNSILKINGPDLLRDLARLSRAVLWLIPEPQARWNSGDSAIRQYAREATALIPCENLRELERGLARVS